MADLSVNKSDSIKAIEQAGQSLILNGDFESAPSFTAATNTSNVWINGTAAGSSTDDSHSWALSSLAGTISTQFDNSTFNSGTNSLKLSTLATNSTVRVTPSTGITSLTSLDKYAIHCIPSTKYVINFYMKTNFNSGDSSDGAFVQLQEYSSSAVQGTVTNSTKVKTTTAFTLYTITRTVAATAVYLWVQPQIVGSTGTATLIMDAWFDDITVYPQTRINGVDLPLSPLITPGIQDISGPKIWS